MPIKTLEKNGLTWINIDRVDQEVLSYLKTQHNFHKLDLEDVQSESQTPKIDVYKKYIFVILQFPYWNAVTRTVIPYEIQFFIGNNFLISIQHHTIENVQDQFKRWLKSKHIKKDWMSETSGYLFYKVIDALFQKSRPVLNDLGKQISTVEDRVFSGQQDTALIKELGLHRRNVLGFRRIIDPQRYLMGNLSHIRKPFLTEDESLYFDDIQDYLTKIWTIIDTYKDTIQGLHVTVESLINQRTNKVIGALTVISVSLLPLTLLSGIYGMNISLPFQDRPIFVWGIFIILSLVILLTIMITQKRRWF